MAGEHAADGGIHVIREASGVVALWKPPGLATQAPPGIPSAESWLRARLPGGSRGYLGVPHRLDRGVSGVVLFATTPRAARKLSRQFERRQVGKEYRALVVCPDEAAAEFERLAAVQAAGESAGATWSDLVEKVPDEARGRIVAAGTPGGREAVTIVRLLARLPPRRLLLELKPVTGRMHQLRLQAAARGMPILGDELYGSAERDWAGAAAGSGPDDPRTRPLALHSFRIGYDDPDGSDRVTVEAELPACWPQDARR
jgi:23S rRNA pseudouridine1911/1915/1917 synthase